MGNKQTLREKVLVKSAQLLEIGFEPFEILAILSALEDKTSATSGLPFWPEGVRSPIDVRGSFIDNVDTFRIHPESGPLYCSSDRNFTDKGCQDKESIPCLMMKADNGFDCFIPAVRDRVKNILIDLYKREEMKKAVLCLKPSGDVITAISVDNISLFEYMKEHPKAKGDNQIAVWATYRGKEAPDKEKAIIDYLKTRYITSGDGREQEPHLVAYTEFATGDKVSLLLNHDIILSMLNWEGFVD